MHDITVLPGKKKAVIRRLYELSKNKTYASTSTLTGSLMSTVPSSSVTAK
jgi:hypothetical protein